MKRKKPRRLSSFGYLNITQFLGALNDNIFQLLLAFLLIDILGAENSAVILATASAVFTIPFLLFLQASGVLADRVSKKNIIVFAKFFELAVMLLGIVAFALRTEVFSYIVLFLMATQSAIFGPSKYGIIPEIVKKERIAKANGYISLFSFGAIILGTFFAAFLTDITNRNFILSASACSLIALVGGWSSLKIKDTPPSGSRTKFNPLFIYEVYKTLNRSRNYNHLLTAILGSAFFLFVGAFLKLNIIPFAIESLGLSDIQGGYLFLFIALGIGTGSLFAGKFSGKRVELGLVPLGGLGIVICCVVLTTFSSSLAVVVPTITLLGISGGFFIVPLDAFIQIASPNEYRGQTIATKSFLSFIGVLAASVVLIFTKKLGFTANQGFIAMGMITFVITITLTMLILDYFVRFMTLVMSKILFKVRATGANRVPSTGPVLLLCRHSSWVNAFLLMATQRRGMRFIIKCKRDRFRWLAPIYRLMKIIPVTDSSGPFYMTTLLKDIRRGFNRDFSICIYIHEDHDEEDTKTAKRYNPVQQLLNEIECPVIPVWVKQKNRSQQFVKVLKRFFKLRGRTKATIAFGAEFSRDRTFTDMYKKLLEDSPYAATKK